MQDDGSPQEIDRFKLRRRMTLSGAEFTRLMEASNCATDAPAFGAPAGCVVVHFAMTRGLDNVWTVDATVVVNNRRVDEVTIYDPNLREINTFKLRRTFDAAALLSGFEHVEDLEAVAN